MRSSLRIDQSLLLEILRITSITGLLIFGVSACKSPTVHSLGFNVTESLPVSNTDYRKIVEISILRWSQDDQNGQYAYTLDPDNVRLGTETPPALGHVLASEPDALPENNFVIFIDEVVVPEPEFVYLTMRTTNRYEGTEFTIVLERIENGWQVRDYFLIAEGLLNITLQNFSWKAYKAGMSELRPSQ